MWCKQWVELRAELNNCGSALSTMPAALGTMDVSCHLNAFAKTASILLRSSTENLTSNGRQSILKACYNKAHEFCLNMHYWSGRNILTKR